MDLRANLIAKANLRRDECLWPYKESKKSTSRRCGTQHPSPLFTGGLPKTIKGAEEIHPVGLNNNKLVSYNVCTFQLQPWKAPIEN